MELVNRFVGNTSLFLLSIIYKNDSRIARASTLLLLLLLGLSHRLVFVHGIFSLVFLLCVYLRMRHLGIGGLLRAFDVLPDRLLAECGVKV